MLRIHNFLFSVPVGYIYTELPGLSAPQAIWPNFLWADESARFAGQFFRVIGSGSGGWGAVQSACAPRISNMRYGGDYGHSEHIAMPHAGWSAAQKTGK